MSSTKKDWKKHFHRMKQIADQNLGRAEKSEVLNEDLVLLEKRVSKIKTVCQNTIKKLTACLPLSATANPDKNIKKLPESMLALTMMDSASSLGNDDTLGKTYSYCAKLQSSLAREIYHYSQQIEKLVLSPIQSVLESEIPAIAKLRKQLTKLTLDMDSAKGRFQSVLKQSHGSSSASLACKVETLKNELEQAENRVQQCRDQLIIELYSFLAREGQLSDVLLALVTSQIDFHRRTLESLENSLPQMKHHTEVLIPRPVFGCSLVSHLEHTRREIALVIEKCVRSLILHGINEEGLFRVASSSTKVKKLKAGFDASIVNMDDYQEDAHCVAAVLKSYLRELPEPLMTFELYSEWMHIMELPTELRQNALWVVVDKLPKPNYSNLRYIIKFLAKLAANSDVNKMSPSNIAIVIGPNLLWAPGDDGPSVLTATSHSAIIECLINKSEWFFPGDLDFGVSEADRLNVTKTRHNDNTGRGHNLSSISSSALTPAYISKHRFFGNVFDEADHNGLKLSPSSTRLSLNSLTSLNDESSFERKYSFSSLLEERTSNWDSEGGSLRWMKMSRVESGTSSLNTSFCYANRRSPIPSSSTSPALSAGNILSYDVNSVTRSQTLSVTTSSSRLSGTSPSVTFGVSSTQLSGSKIPTLSASKNTIPLVSIAKGSAIALFSDGTLSRNNGLIASSPPQSSTSSDVSVTRQSQSVTTESALSASIVTTNISSSSENSELAVSTTPAASLTTTPDVSLTTTPEVSLTISPAVNTAASMSEHLAVSTTSIPTITLMTDAPVSVTPPAVLVTSSRDVSRTSNPTFTVTGPVVSVTSAPADSPTTSPALPSTASMHISEGDTPYSLTPKTHELTQENDSELVTNSELVDSEKQQAENYPIVISTSKHFFDPLMSGNPLQPISFSRHIIISPTSPSAVSDSSQQTSDDVFNSLDMSPRSAVKMTCPSDGRTRRVVSEGSWTLVPNGDCRELSFGKVAWVDDPNARRRSEGNGAPGKERVRFQGLSKQTSSMTFKERPSERRLSIPSVSMISPETQKSKQPVKKARSVSISSGRTLPYVAPTYTSLNTNSISRKTTVPPERRIKARSDGNTMTLYEKNGETLCNDNSVINCTKSTGYLSRNTLTRLESATSRTVETSPTRKQNTSRNSDENPFDGASVRSGQGIITASKESKLCINDDFATRERTVLSDNVSDKPEADRDRDELTMDCSCRHGLPNELVLSGVTSGSDDAPPSPLSSAEKKSPNRTLQRPLFPPPPVPDIPAKNSASSD